MVALEYSIDGGAFQKSEGGVAFDRVGEFKLAARGWRRTESRARP
ncbi:MAG: hypothetical protein U1F87_17120 [Kiritimatiellia bacterium]